MKAFPNTYSKESRKKIDDFRDLTEHWGLSTHFINRMEDGIKAGDSNVYFEPDRLNDQDKRWLQQNGYKLTMITEI